MGTILLLGLLVGMQHALEADHIAAVASLAARKSSVRNFFRHGFVWGVGHALTLMLFAGAALYLEFSMGEGLADLFEAGVGLLLVGLGSHLLYRLWQDKIHFHSHRHDDGVFHFHAHSHFGDVKGHNNSDHIHEHPRGLPVRSLVVGMIHGLAGSAALLILAAAAVKDPVNGLLYIAMFGVGSVIGMAALSVLIALPISYSARVMTLVNRGFQGVIGAGTLIFGAVIFLRSALASEGSLESPFFFRLFNFIQM